MLAEPLAQQFGSTNGSTTPTTPGLSVNVHTLASDSYTPNCIALLQLVHTGVLPSPYFFEIVA